MAFCNGSPAGLTQWCEACHLEDTLADGSSSVIGVVTTLPSTHQRLDGGRGGEALAIAYLFTPQFGGNGPSRHGNSYQLLLCSLPMAEAARLACCSECCKPIQDKR